MLTADPRMVHRYPGPPAAEPPDYGGSCPVLTPSFSGLELIRLVWVTSPTKLDQAKVEKIGHLSYLKTQTMP